MAASYKSGYKCALENREVATFQRFKTLGKNPTKSVVPRALQWQPCNQSDAEPPTVLASLTFNGVEYYDNNVAVQLKSRELTQMFKALASANGHAYSSLMANDKILPNVPLNCCLIKTLPAGFSSMNGYIVAKIRGSTTAVGHSFWSDGTSEESDLSFVPPRVKSSAHREPGSPRRSPARDSAPKCMAEAPLTPTSMEGSTQPMPILLHRAAALAASGQPDKDSKMYGVLHICGNKNCGVVGHYRPGTRGNNEADEDHHGRHPDTSRRSHPRLQ